MATLTITTPATDDPRILRAFGAYLNLGRDATGAEVKSAVINFMKGVVRKQEQAAAIGAIVPQADIGPT